MAFEPSSVAFWPTTEPTQVYKRQAGEWWLVHRHADPLVNRIGLERAAEIARGAVAED